jgi:crotonobetainyl-CoA:carnitine CoA-transferase CaiB-like acyl-CoA transferase
MDGVKVLEVATWGVAPVAATILCDWGADVIKVEHPVTGDPVRGVFSRFRGGAGAVDATWEHLNRGKRSIGIDVSTPIGQEVVHRLARDADVFVTSYPTERRRQFRVEIEDIRAVNPRIVYGRVTAYGPRGPDAAKPGHDLHAWWSRSGAGNAMMVTAGSEYAPPPPVGAMGDYATGIMLAGGLAAALFKRDRTGEPSVVDNSLFGAGIWSMAYSIVTDTEYARPVKAGHANALNPVSNTYRTKDGRFIHLSLVQSDRWWDDFCRHIERPELIDDPRYRDFGARARNSRELIALLDALFAERDYEEWVARLQSLRGPWSPVARAAEVRDDEQAIANEYVTQLTASDGSSVTVVSAPVQFDESAPKLERAPELAEHTEEILIEHGYGWEEIAALKESGAIS